MEKRNLYISWTLRVFLFGLFVFSAITKMLPLTPFEKQLVDLGFADWHTAPYFARLIIGVELGLGIALIQNHRHSCYCPFARCVLYSPFLPDCYWSGR